MCKRRDASLEPAVEGRQRGAHDEGNQQQKSDAEHHAERQQAHAEKFPPRSGPSARRRPPDLVERMLQFAEYTGRTDEQRDHADSRGEATLVAVVRALEKVAHGIGARRAGECAQLPEQFRFRRVRAETRNRRLPAQ